MSIGNSNSFKHPELCKKNVFMKMLMITLRIRKILSVEFEKLN